MLLESGQTGCSTSAEPGTAARAGLRRGWARVAALAVVLVSLGLTACGGSDDASSSAGDSGGGDAPEVKLHGLEGGVSAAAIDIMVEQGFDKKNGFTAKVRHASADASTQFLLQGQSDVSFDGDPITAARLRSQGNKVTTFYPLVTQEATLMVPKDSSVTSPKDLAGKKVGVPGLDWGYVTAAQVMLKAFEDVDIAKDYELQVTPEATLIRLANRGDLDASLLDNPLTILAALKFGFKTVWGPGAEVWKEKTGGSNWNISIMAKDEWIEANPELAKGVAAAWDDTYAWIKEDPTRLVAGKHGEALGIEDDDVKAEFVKLVADGKFFTNSWTDDDVAAGERFLEEAVKTGLIDEAPAGSVTKLP